jgi:hypothetical protein
MTNGALDHVEAEKEFLRIFGSSGVAYAIEDLHRWQRCYRFSRNNLHRWRRRYRVPRKSFEVEEFREWLKNVGRKGEDR